MTQRGRFTGFRVEVAAFEPGGGWHKQGRSGNYEPKVRVVFDATPRDH